MRSFPSAPGRRAAAAGLAVVLTTGLGTLPTAGPAHADWRDTLRQTQQRIETAQGDIAEASRRAQRATAALGRATVRLAGARDRLAGLESRVRDASARREALTVELGRSRRQLVRSRASLAAARAEVQVTRERATETITSIYQSGAEPGLRTLSSFLTAGSLEEIEREQQAEGLIVDRQAAAYDAVKESRARLAAMEAALEQDTADLARKRAQADRLVTRLRVLRGRAEAARDLVVDTLERSRSARQRAVSARAEDQAALRRLRAQESAVKAKILAAQRAAARAGSGYTGSTTSLLSAPAAGSVTSPFGYRTHPIHGYHGLHDGTDFGAACGSALRAAADGTVISASYSSVYGHRLYLSLGNINGRNLTVVYNHASGYRYGVGAQVSRGTTLGYVGSTGWSTGCHLHFTVLENGVAVDPMRYL